MQQSTQISAFGSILLFLVLGTAFVLVTLLMSKIISPKKPNFEKLTTYECGEEPMGSSWIQFNMRFYVIALVFLLFDVELIFLFPWSTVFGNKELIAAIPSWGWLSFFEMTIFISILLVGLVYVWKKGDLNWVKPQPVIPVVDTKIPSSLYQQLNLENYRVRAFVQVPIPEDKKETLSVEKSERRQYAPKTVTENTEQSTVAESVNATETETQAKPAYQPKFKPKTTPAETTSSDQGTVEKTAENAGEKPAYKPRFKPQVTEATQASKTASTEETSEAKPAYVPKFKPKLTSASTNEIKAEEKPEASNEIQENKQEETVKQAYVPKFKPRMASANTTEANRAENIESVSEPQEIKAGEPVKQAYVPKFKPRMAQKTEDINNGESSTSVSETTNNVPATENPVSEETSKPSAYKPRFKPTMVKKEEDNSTTNTEDQ
ncbi:NAD(P)H-quinone oxidoreductase subunit 3 [compost metagenome]